MSDSPSERSLVKRRHLGSAPRVVSMPKVFVHGNPECDAVWDPLVAALADRGVDDCILLSPPGFGAPVPDGFRATPAGYVEWLAAELRDLNGPIDLVGHDWGTGHVAGLAAAYPELIRSFTVDCGGLIHPDYVWHDMAQVWQTPGAGEQAIAAMVDIAHGDKVAMFESFGVPADIAERMAAAVDQAMGECVLTLYRAGAQPFQAELSARLDAADPRPAHIISALDDPYVPAALGAATADRLNAHHSPLPMQGHWWMIADPEGPADAMKTFWDAL